MSQNSLERAFEIPKNISLTLVRRSLLLNRTEKLTTQAKKTFEKIENGNWVKMGVGISLD